MTQETIYKCNICRNKFANDNISVKSTALIVGIRFGAGNTFDYVSPPDARAHICKDCLERLVALGTPFVGESE